MSGPAVHAAAGALAGVAPDAALALFVRRAEWVGPDHPLFRLHRALHQPQSLVLAVALGWASHLLLDRLTDHRLSETESGRRGWFW